LVARPIYRRAGTRDAQRAREGDYQFIFLTSINRLPEEAQALKEIAALKAQLAAAAGDVERAKLKKALDDKLLSFNVLLEQQQRGRRPRRRRS